jgi:hypothetical protein
MQTASPTSRALVRPAVGTGLLRRTPALALGFVLLLQGCAGLVPGKREATVPAETRPGRVIVQKGRPGLVIGAARGGVEQNTDLIASDLARLTGFGLVVVVDEPGEPGPGARALAAPARFDPDSARARGLGEAYRRLVADAAQGPPTLYVEIGGHGPGGSVGRVEIATVGLGRDDAWRLETLFEMIRDTRLDDAGVPRLEVRVAPEMPARASSLAVAPRAFRIDLPGAARTTYREIYTQVLGAFLTESAGVLVPRPR